jgi:hypothetical protein
LGLDSEDAPPSTFDIPMEAEVAVEFDVCVAISSAMALSQTELVMTALSSFEYC